MKSVISGIDFSQKVGVDKSLQPQLGQQMTIGILIGGAVLTVGFAKKISK
jgi:hypothetical protein